MSVFQPFGAPGRELLFRQARLGAAQVVGRLGVDDLRQRQVETFLWKSSSPVIEPVTSRSRGSRASAR